MKLVILGAGEVGYNIAQRLAEEGYNIAVVDNEPARLQHVEDTLDVATVLGNAAHPSILEQAGCRGADMLIAATRNDEVNMIACQVAHTLFRVPTKIARIRAQDYLAHPEIFGRDELPVDEAISPEREAAKAILRRFKVSCAADVHEFADGKLLIMALKIPKHSGKYGLAGLSLSEFPEYMQEAGLKVYVLARQHNNVWCVPRGDTVLFAGDSIYLSMPSKQLNCFLQHIGLASEQNNKRSLMIIGGGNIGFHVAQDLGDNGHSVRLIEHNKERVEWLSQNLKNGIVLQGDALDRKLLVEENISRMDDFLALTNDDETNILASLIAREHKVDHIVTLVNRGIYSSLMGQIGLNVIVSPRLTTVASILQFVRKGKVLRMSSIADGALDVVELEAMETSRILNSPLRSLNLPEGLAIGAILRQNTLLIPNGDTCILPHDHVIVVAHRKSISVVEDLFQVRLEFF
ncbi:MAG: Trk system potassium transporter TrkA [Mariprofundales bacterium]